MMKNSCWLFVILFTLQLNAQSYLLKADHAFDGERMHSNYWVLVENNIITQSGPAESFLIPGEAKQIEFNDQTLMPGLIEGHAHLFLHPYDETEWNDQVLKESVEFRTIRAVNYAESTLMAGYTTIRDLGTEGANVADVAIKKAIEEGIIIGPRMQIATRAIVATGSYGPKGFRPDMLVPLGAEIADGHDNIIKVVRDQIGQGADFIKVYADYRWGPNKEAMPTFSIEELKLMVTTAASSGRVVVAHAATKEGMRRATEAGVKTIEHGHDGDEEIFTLMKNKGVALCPTLAAGYFITQYRGWDPEKEEEPERIQNKRKSFAAALKSGVAICAGSDVGVFTHGNNAVEQELMVEYGMNPLSVLQSSTSINADWFGLKNQVGRLKVGLFADIIAVSGNPVQDISALKKINFIMKDGVIYKQ